MSLTEDIKQLHRDGVLLGKKAIVADIKIEILKRPGDEITTKDLIKILDKIIEKEESKRGENIWQEKLTVCTLKL